jgi:hypothetical protein
MIGIFVWAACQAALLLAIGAGSVLNPPSDPPSKQ